MSSRQVWPTRARFRTARAVARKILSRNKQANKQKSGIEQKQSKRLESISYHIKLGIASQNLSKNLVGMIEFYFYAVSRKYKASLPQFIFA